jgi:hypothetical protein
MKNSNLLVAFVWVLACIMFSSCAAIGGIFKAGMGVGIFVVVVVVAIIIALIARAGKK